MGINQYVAEPGMGWCSCTWPTPSYDHCGSQARRRELGKKNEVDRHIECDKPMDMQGDGGAELCTSSQRNRRAAEEEAVELKGGENFPREARVKHPTPQRRPLRGRRLI